VGEDRGWVVVKGRGGDRVARGSDERGAGGGVWGGGPGRVGAGGEGGERARGGEVGLVERERGGV